MDQEKADMETKLVELRKECERMAKEKADAIQQMMKEMKEMTKIREDMMAKLRAECVQKVLKEKAEMTGKMAEFKAECDQMAEEKAEMERKMVKFRAECDAKVKP